MAKSQNIQAHGGRFGPGKVHEPQIGSKASDCIVLCSGRHVHGKPVDAKENPVTCKHCLDKTPY